MFGVSPEGACDHYGWAKICFDDIMSFEFGSRRTMMSCVRREMISS